MIGTKVRVANTLLLRAAFSFTINSVALSIVTDPGGYRTQWGPYHRHYYEMRRERDNSLVMAACV